MLQRLLAIFFAVALVILGLFWFTGKHPQLKLASPVTTIGTATPLSVQVDDAAGIKRFSATLTQNGQSQTVFEDLTRSKQTSRLFKFPVGKQVASFLKEGAAHLTISAASNDFRGATETIEQDVQVILRPPTIVTDGKQHYIN